MLLQFSATIYKQDKRMQNFGWKKVVQKNESAWKHNCIVEKSVSETLKTWKLSLSAELVKCFRWAILQKPEDTRYKYIF